MSQTLKPNRAIELFVSYAHEDEELWNELSKHLSNLKRRNVISVWHDRQIGAGREWKNEIDAHLNTAHIILLLVSADFLASDYCYDVELEKAMERHKAQEARVIPVILRDCDLEHSVFSTLNYLPTDGKPVTNPKYWSTRDEAFRNVAEGIRHAVEELILGLFEKLTRAESLRNWPNVIDLGERILKMIPDHEPTRAKTAVAYIKKWSRCFNESPQDVIGYIEIKTKRREDPVQVINQIIADLNRAIQLEPENAEYYYLRFSVLRALLTTGGAMGVLSFDDFERFRESSLADLERAIQLEPSTAQYYLARAIIRDQNDDAEGALRDRQRASELEWEEPGIPGTPPVTPAEFLDDLRNRPKLREFKERWRLKCLRD